MQAEEVMELALALPVAIARDSDLGLLRLPIRGLLSFQVSRQSPSALAALQSALGFEPPSRPNSATKCQDVHCLWISPRYWLIESDFASSERLFVDLALQSQGTAGTARVMRSSDCFDSVRVSGVAATSLLATGCALDLRDSAAPPNTALRTRFADVPIILYKLSATMFHLHVDVSLSHYLWLWLTDARQSFVSERDR